MANDDPQFLQDFDERYDAQKDEDDKLFIKGFNAGYLLSKHEPELLDRVLKSPNEEFFYIGGMKAGKTQHDKEKFIEQVKQKNNQSMDKEKEW